MFLGILPWLLIKGHTYKNCPWSPHGPWICMLRVLIIHRIQVKFQMVISFRTNRRVEILHDQFKGIWWCWQLVLSFQWPLRYYYLYPKPCKMILNRRIIKSQSITLNSQKMINLLLLNISLCRSIGFQVQASYSCISLRFWHQGTIVFTYGVLFFIGYLDSPIL